MIASYFSPCSIRLDTLREPSSSHVNNSVSNFIPLIPVDSKANIIFFEIFSSCPPNSGKEVSRTLGFTCHRRAIHSCVLRGQRIVIFIRQRPDHGVMTADYVVEVVDDEVDGAGPLGVVKVIWYEISGGIGPWGALRPLIAIALALIPFLFIGQHFNRQHRKAASWFAVQFPLILTVVLWPLLYIWSIGDAWWVSSGIVARAESS